MPRNRKQQVVLITGASSGIGLAVARSFQAAGHTTYASARRAASLADLKREGFDTVQLDVADEASVQAAVDQVEAEHGAVDVLVNNAGYGLQGPLEEVSLERLRDEFEVNVFGLLRVSQLVLPAMRAQRYGRIINIGSIGGTFTSPGAGPYHMSKYAVESLSDALRAEVRGFGVDVVLVQPTGVRTTFVNKQVETMPDTGSDSPYRAFKEAMAKSSLALFEANSSAVVSPEDVARVVLHAARTRRPGTRYKVGASARILAMMRGAMSDRAFDSFLLRQVGVVPGRAKAS